MTEETQAVEPTPEERKRQAGIFESYVVQIMLATKASELIAARDALPADNVVYRGIINARLRILRGLD